MEWLATHWQTIADWFIRTFFVSGIGWTGWKFIKERRSREAKATVEEAQAEVEGATIDNKVVSSSITTLEASRLSMLAGWESERRALLDTAAFHEEQVEKLRQRDRERDIREAEKDRLIQELRDQVAMLQERIRHQAAELTEIADRLCELQTEPREGA